MLSTLATRSYNARMRMVSDELGMQRIAAGEVLRIRAGLGRIVTCGAGAIWITQQGDPRDIVLGPGERFVLDRQGLALISPADGASSAIVAVSPSGETRARSDEPARCKT